jgi:chorismate mutase
LAVRGIRGATTVSENSRESILSGTRELLLALRDANNFKTEDIVSIFFSMTSDLNTAFPAEAARQLGWNKVPLFGMQESEIEGGLEKCIRILIQINSSQRQEEIKYCYLHEAKMLRKDINCKEEREDKKWF